MAELSELRSRLDKIDEQLITLFEERMSVSREIGAYKRVNSIPITDESREREITESRSKNASAECAEGIRSLMRLLIEESKRVQRKGLNLYLIGMPDCGKTRTGKKLAPLLKMPLADTDEIIMKNESRTIDEIFEQDGEEGFRECEAAALDAVAAHGGLIVATGGGMPVWKNNAHVMKCSGIIVFLDRPLERLHGQNTRNRPLLKGDVNANIDRLYALRYEVYKNCADLIINPDEDGAAERIAEYYSNAIRI